MFRDWWVFLLRDWWLFFFFLPFHHSLYQAQGLEWKVLPGPRWPWLRHHLYAAPWRGWKGGAGTVESSCRTAPAEMGKV